MDAAHHRRVELHLNELARRHFPPGSFHFNFADIAKLGGGNMERGEQILQQMFRLVGPRSLHPEAVRQVGNGSILVGRKVLKKFIERMQPADQDSEPPSIIEYARGGKVKMSKVAANYRDSAEDNKFCARCNMHLPRTNSCTLVAGQVHRVGLCDYFEQEG
jgi:hypothetical protein